MKTLKYSAKGAAQLCCYTIALIATVLFTSTTQAQEMTEREACLGAQGLIGIIGEMRDDAQDPRQVVMGLVAIGIPTDTANMATYFVYEVFKDKPVEEVQEIFFDNCLGSGA